MIHLFIADLFWSAAAWFVDYPKLSSIPIWGWPFALLCPVYPLLLAFVWWSLLKGKKINPYLLALAVLPSAVLGILAIFYYSFKISFQGFSLRDFGQIFWVLFYSTQGWYLLFIQRIGSKPVQVSLLFFILLLAIDFKFKTFGYLSFDAFSDLSICLLLSIGVLSSVAVAILAIRRSSSV